MKTSYNSAGQLVWQEKLTDHSGTANLNTSTWAGGLYFAVIQYDGLLSPVLKLVISK